MKGKDKGPRPLGEALEGYLQRTGLGQKIEAASVVPEWDGLVGEKIASVTSPLRVSGDTLFVAVRSSAWLMELKLMEREILRRVNQGRTRGRIGHIRFVMAEGAPPGEGRRA